MTTGRGHSHRGLRERIPPKRGARTSGSKSTFMENNKGMQGTKNGRKKDLGYLA